MRGYIEQEQVNTLVLAKLFHAAQTSNNGLWDGALVDFFAPRLGRQRVMMALDVCYKSDHVLFVRDEEGDFIYSITPLGYEVIENMYLRTSPFLREVIDDNFSVFLGQEDSGQPLSLEGMVPASDRFVSISDNMPGYNEVISTVEQAGEAIRGSNALPAEARSWLKIHIDLGLELVRKGGTTLRNALNALIVEPLKAALAETSEDGIKVIIKAALAALKSFFGLS